MDPTIAVAIIAAVPATIAALRAGTGVKEIRRVKSMLNAHLADPEAHKPTARRVRVVPRERAEGT